jgi:hypothetical protein
MKTTLLSFVTLLTLSSGICTAKGGGDDSKILIGVSVGAGLPMGAFGTADNTPANDNSHINGWAKTGLHFDLNAGYKFTDNIGGMLMIGGNMNAFNASAFDAKNPHPGYTTTATSHYIGSYMVGPFLNLPVGDKFAITARVLVGLMTAKFAEITETAGSSTFVTKYATPSTFGYDAGAGVKIGLTDALGLAINVDYLGGTPTFVSYTTTANTAIGSSATTHTGSAAMSTGLVNLSVGIVLGF